VCIQYGQQCCEVTNLQRPGRSRKFPGRNLKRSRRCAY